MPTWLVVCAAAVVGAGVALGGGHGGIALHLTASAAAAFALAASLSDRRRVAAIVALAGVGLAGAADAAWRDAAARAHLLPRLAGDEAVVRVCGTVVARGPRSLEIRALGVRIGDRRWEVREPARFTGDDVGAFGPGDGVCAGGELVEAREGRGEPPLLVADSLGPGPGGSAVRKAAGVVRDRFSEAARRALPPTQAGLLLGMTDGDVELLDERTMEAFRTTGLAHLVAVSGSNVAVVLAVVAFGLAWVGPRNRWIRAALAVPPLVFFAFLTALEPSVLRATVSAGVVLAIGASGRIADGVRVAAVAFALLVLVSPELLWRPGFQLSFGATLGLILFARPLADRLLALHPGTPGRAATAIAVAVSTTIAAQAAVAPLLAVHFGQVPAVGGVANLLVAPLAGVVMLGGMVTLGAASLWDAVGWAPATMRLLLDVILWAARFFADLPGASLTVGIPTGVAIAAGLAVFAVRGRARTIALAVAVLGATLSIGQGVVPSGVVCEGPEIRALDVGQGTAVLVRDAEHAALVDGGPYEGRVTDHLAALGVSHLDAVLVSHPHADHTEGLVRVLDRMSVGSVLGPATTGWGVGRDVLAAARRGGVPFREVAAGDIVRLGDAIRIVVLHPEGGPAPEPSEEAVNRYSLVLRVEVAGVASILPGDLGARDQATLVGTHLEAPVLVAPHHGSADLEPSFVEAVGPRVTVVTVGENRYGHPTARALKLFREHGAVLRTDTDGAVSVCLAGGGADGAEVMASR